MLANTNGDWRAKILFLIIPLFPYSIMLRMIQLYKVHTKFQPFLENYIYWPPLDSPWANPASIKEKTYVMRTGLPLTMVTSIMPVQILPSFLSRLTDSE